MDLRRWFLPRNADVLGTLREQARVTAEGVSAFEEWSAGHLEDPGAVEAAEHHADDLRHQLQADLRASFSTPLDAEDIYELSERLDSVMNAARDTVREAELMAMDPDPAMAEMATDVSAGVYHLVAAFGWLGKDGARATAESDAARTAARGIEHRYRHAMSALLAESDVRVLMGRRELYRRYGRLGDSIVSVAERVWYAVVKES